jgi:hypothetical protein
MNNKEFGFVGYKYMHMAKMLEARNVARERISIKSA